MQPIQSIALDQHSFTLTHAHHVVQNVDLSLPKLPPHPLFLNRDPDYKTELAHWTSVSARLCSDLALINAIIEGLQSLVQPIRDSLKEIGNVCAPVYVLPTEILQEIFSLVVDDAGPPSTRQARILSCVCSHWRTAALACAYIWTSVDIMPMLNPSKSEYLLWWCARVRNYPTHITLRSPPALRFGKPEVLHAYLIAGLIHLGMTANHVRSINVSDKYVSDAIRRIGPIPIHFPSLKSVDMRCNLGLRLARIGRDSSRWSVPLLRDITLSMNFGWKSEGLWFLDGLLSPSVQRLTFLEGMLEISQLKEVLASCPNLVELNLNGVDYFRDGELGSTEPGGPFNLESLKGLSITECDPMESLEILAEIVTFTTLNRVTLEWIGHERLGAWFRQLIRNSPELRKVDLTFLSHGPVATSLRRLCEQDVAEPFSLRPQHLEELIVTTDEGYMDYSISWKNDVHAAFRQMLERFCSDGPGLEPRRVIPTLIVPRWLLSDDLRWYEERVGNLIIHSEED